MQNAIYEEKPDHYHIYHCLKVKLSFHEKLFQNKKNKLLLWIYDQCKLPVTSFN